MTEDRAITGHPAGEDSHPVELHEHAHEHDDGVLHEHAHHHSTPSHAHAHGLGFDQLSRRISPVHDLDPRAKIAAGLALVFAIVLSGPLRPAEAIAAFALLMAITFVADLPLGTMLARSAIVIPLAGTIALFAPLARSGGSWNAVAVGEAYRTGWIVAWAILSKAWFSAYIALLVSASTTPPRLFQGLHALRTPAIFITMLTFLYRYAAVLGDQLRSLRLALASRGFNTRGRRLVSLYGNLAGNLFVRAYERGERVYAAMLARGFTGILPQTEQLAMTRADGLAIALALLSATAIALY